ncbi:hypothetical protein CONPUDRAFT_169612, partial [Coniophora puteana RWD-64-598 SS2]
MRIPNAPYTRLSSSRAIPSFSPPRYSLSRSSVLWHGPRPLFRSNQEEEAKQSPPTPPTKRPTQLFGLLVKARVSYARKLITSTKHARMRALVDFETMPPSISAALTPPPVFTNADAGPSRLENRVPQDFTAPKGSGSPPADEDASLGAGDMSFTDDFVQEAEQVPRVDEFDQRMRSSSLTSSYDSVPASGQSIPITTGRRPSDTSLPAFKTEYHPKSGRPTRFYSYEEFRRPVQQQVFEKDEHPWRPFRSHADYELASIAVDAQMSDSLVRRLLELVKGVKSGQANVTFESVKNVRDACDTATNTFTPFELHDVVINYKGEDLHHDFYGRDMFDWALDLLENEALAPHFVWDAQRHYKYNGSEYVRFIDEPWSADRWWAIQEDLPKLGDHPAAPLAFVLYADKTRLSSAGNVQGYPVVARCANLPADIRNGKGSGGGYVVGWLPIVEDNSEEDGTLAYTTLKRVLWHDSVRKLFENAQDSSKNGFFYEKCHDGIPRWLYFTILILSADYEEQTTMVLNRGAGGNHPCPVCLVPKKQQHDLSQHFPRRSEAETQAVVVQYNQPNIDPAEKRRLGARLDELSIHQENSGLLIKYFLVLIAFSALFKHEIRT